MFSWDDLRYLLAVAEHGSALAAARALGINQSTVQRRLSGPEATLGRTVAERAPPLGGVGVRASRGAGCCNGDHGVRPAGGGRARSRSGRFIPKRTLASYFV